MKILLHGDKAKTGRRTLDCTNCHAQLQITKLDVSICYLENEWKPIGEDRFYTEFRVTCPECGRAIKVKNQMENMETPKVASQEGV